MSRSLGYEVLISMTPDGQQHLADSYVDAIRNMAIAQLLTDQILHTWQDLSSFSDMAQLILGPATTKRTSEKTEEQLDRLHYLINHLVNAPIPGFNISLEDVFQTQGDKAGLSVSVIEKTIAVVLSGLRQLTEEIADENQRKELQWLLAQYEARYNATDFDHQELTDTAQIIGSHDIIKQALGLAEDETLPTFSLRFLQMLGEDAAQSDHILGLLDEGADPQELIEQLKNKNGEYHVTTNDERHSLSFNMALGLVILAMTDEQLDSLNLKIASAWDEPGVADVIDSNLDVEELVAFIRASTQGG